MHEKKLVKQRHIEVAMNVRERDLPESKEIIYHARAHGFLGERFLMHDA